jgi:putative ABC transport system substrate-binding protein
MGAKWLELLKEVAPGVTRVAVLRNSGATSGTGVLGAIQAVAPSFGVELRPVDVRDPGEIEHAITAFAGAPHGGLMVTQATLTVLHRKLIITLAARLKLPAVYAERLFVDDGGLIAYGPNFLNQYRRAAGATSTASSRATSPPTCRCRPRPSMSWWSTSRPLGRSASKCRRRCSPAPIE